MGNAVSTITSKWQVTIPEDVRKDIPLKVGQRIAWSVVKDKLVGQRVPSIGELSGCFKSEGSSTARKRTPASFAEAAVVRHDRISKQGR